MKRKEFLLTSERPGVKDGITCGSRGVYTAFREGNSIYGIQ